jgi:hypothetical protein
VTFTLLSKPDCPLCHEMKEVVVRVLKDPRLLVEVDIRSDPALEKRYLLEIPVLLQGDKVIARYRVGEEELRRLLAGPGPNAKPAT